MAFTKASFAPIGGQATRGRAPQIFAYKTTDAAADVDTSGYFNGVANIVEVGDVILRLTLSGSAVSTTGWHVVVSNTGGVVDVSDTTALTVTDTD